MLEVALNTRHEINITVNLGRDGNTPLFFIIKEAKETVLDFLKRAVGVW